MKRWGFWSQENSLDGFAIRDQLIFTNKRIIAIDVQGITGNVNLYIHALLKGTVLASRPPVF